MTKHLSLQIILVISLAGTLFSGFLSYQELFLGGCNFFSISCGIHSAVLWNIPACVIGLFMYLTIFIITFLGLKGKK